MDVARDITLPASTLPKKDMARAAKLPAATPVAVNPSFNKSRTPFPVQSTILPSTFTIPAAHALPIFNRLSKKRRFSIRRNLFFRLYKLLNCYFTVNDGLKLLKNYFYKRML